MTYVTMHAAISEDGSSPTYTALVDAAAPSQAELDAMLAAAQTLWAVEGGEAAPETTIRLADLPGAELGRSTANGVVIDTDAAGHGWFIDTTPTENEEYTGGGYVLSASDDEDASGRIDLLTVVLHELGHELGYADGELPVMAEALETGQRIMLQPGADEPRSRLPQSVALPDAGEGLPDPRVLEDAGLSLADDIRRLPATERASELVYGKPTEGGPAVSIPNGRQHNADGTATTRGLRVERALEELGLGEASPVFDTNNDPWLQAPLGGWLEKVRGFLASRAEPDNIRDISHIDSNKKKESSEETKPVPEWRDAFVSRAADLEADPNEALSLSLDVDAEPEVLPDSRASIWQRFARRF